MPSIIVGPLGLKALPAITSDALTTSPPLPTVLLPGAEGFPAHTRFTRALTPPKKAPGFVPEMNYVGLTPRDKAQEDTRLFRTELRQMATAYPDVLDMARTLAKTFIKKHTGKDLDPDKIYFHRFHEAFSGSKAHSGWRHAQVPDESTTLTRLFMHRFTSRDEMSGDSLDQMSGIYEVKNAELYDEKNEVPVLPSVLMKALWKIDFSSTYKKKIDDFWSTYSTQFRANLKGSLLIELLTAQDTGELSASDFNSFGSLLTSTTSPSSLTARQLLDVEVRPPASLHIFPFNILGHEATDLLLTVLPSGKQILYAPGATPAIVSVENEAVLYGWIKKTLDDPQSRRALLAHFPARAMDDGLQNKVQKIIRGEFPLVHTPSGTIAHAIVKYPLGARITQDIPSALRDRIRDRMKDDAGFYLRSNSEISRQQWIDSLSDFARVGGALAPLSPLIALPVIGAGMVRIGLNINKAVSADTVEERRAGAEDATAGAVEVLFNLPLLASQKVGSIGPVGTVGTAISVATHERGAGVSGVENVVGQTVEDAPSPEQDEPVPESNSIAKLEEIQPIPTLPLVKLPPPELASYELPFTMNERFGVGDGTRVLFNQSDDRHYLEVLGKTFQVRYDASIGAWVIINPKNPYAFFGSRPVRLDINNQWEITPTAALRGGAPLITKEVSSPALEGVTVVSPQPGEYVQRYEMIFESSPIDVKYHPPSNTWRTSDGAAYRHDTGSGMIIRVPHPNASLPVSTADMNKALESLGLQAKYPLELPPLDTHTFQNIPRRISSLWLGKRVPLAHIKNIESNALIASEGKRPFKSILYLSISDPAERAIAYRELALLAPHVQILDLENTAFFKAFKSGPGYEQYLAATRSRGGNLSSASDLLRYPMMDAEGGLYLDIDDTLISKLPGGKRFGDLEFKAPPNGLILNEPVNHEVLGMRSDFNSSNFGTLPNNALLRAVSKRITKRFRTNSTFYDSRPYQGSDTSQTMSTYAHTLNEMTGPGVLNTIIGEQMPNYRQFCGLLRIAHGELYLEQAELDRITHLLIDSQSTYAALGDVIEVNSTSSWLENR